MGEDPITASELIDMAGAYLWEGLTVYEVCVRFQRDYVEVRQAFEDWQVPLRRGTPPEPRVVPKRVELPPARRLPRKPRRQEGETKPDYLDRVAAWRWTRDVLPDLRTAMFVPDREPKRHQRGDVFTSGDRYERGIKRGGDYVGLMARRRRETAARLWHPGVALELRQAGLMGGSRPARRTGRYWH